MNRTRLRLDTIVDLLTRKNLSQNWLAKKLNISSGYMSQLLTGQRTPSPNLRARILDHFPESKFDDLFEIMK